MCRFFFSFSNKPLHGTLTLGASFYFECFFKTLLLVMFSLPESCERLFLGGVNFQSSRSSGAPSILFPFFFFFSLEGRRLFSLLGGPAKYRVLITPWRSVPASPIIKRIC